MFVNLTKEKVGLKPSVKSWNSFTKTDDAATEIGIAQYSA